MKDDDVMSAEEFFEEEIDLEPKNPLPVARKRLKKAKKDIFAGIKVKMVMRIYGVSRARALEIIAGRAAEKKALEDAKEKKGKKERNNAGKFLSAEEFFGEIADGTLNYFGYEIHDPYVTIEGDHATLTGSTTLDARVYGASGSWTLPTNAHFVEVDGKWIQCD